jgi:hypothetical protein
VPGLADVYPQALDPLVVRNILSSCQQECQLPHTAEGVSFPQEIQCLANWAPRCTPPFREKPCRQRNRRWACRFEAPTRPAAAAITTVPSAASLSYAIVRREDENTMKETLLWSPLCVKISIFGDARARAAVRAQQAAHTAGRTSGSGMQSALGTQPHHGKNHQQQQGSTPCCSDKQRSAASRHRDADQ